MNIFDMMLGLCTNGEVWALSMPNEKGGGPSRHVATRSNNRLEKFCRKYDEPGRSTYFCVSTIKEGVPRKKENAVESAYLFNDVDFKDHTASADEILNVLLSQRCPPTRVHGTGGGLHNFWWLDAPVGPDQADRYERLLRRLADVFGGDPSVCHRVGLLRVPGTTNSKRAEAKVVSVIRDTAIRYTLDGLEQWLAEIPQPLIVTRGGSRETNPFLRTASDQAFKPPIDVEQRLKDMTFKGTGDASIHRTQLQCTAALMVRGVDIDEAVDQVLQATQDLPNTSSWNWRIEKREIYAMCTDWIEDHPPAPVIEPVSLADAQKSRDIKNGHVIPNGFDAMPSPGGTTHTTSASMIELLEAGAVVSAAPETKRNDALNLQAFEWDNSSVLGDCSSKPLASN